MRTSNLFRLVEPDDSIRSRSAARLYLLQMRDDGGALGVSVPYGVSGVMVGIGAVFESCIFFMSKQCKLISFVVLLKPSG